jgi:hypothetical protein
VSLRGSILPRRRPPLDQPNMRDSSTNLPQVVSYEGLEVHHHSDLEAVKTDPRWHQETAFAAYSPGDGNSKETRPPKKRICGLATTTFWLVLGMAILAASVIGLGTGLGIGLSRAQAQNANASSGSKSTWLQQS